MQQKSNTPKKRPAKRTRPRGTSEVDYSKEAIGMTEPAKGAIGQAVNAESNRRMEIKDHLNTVVDAYVIGKFDRDGSLAENGMDSMEATELEADLEYKYNIHFPKKSFHRNLTTNEIVDLIVEQLDNK